MGRKADEAKKNLSGQKGGVPQAPQNETKLKKQKMENQIRKIFGQKFSKHIRKNVSEKVVQKYPDKMFRSNLDSMNGQQLPACRAGRGHQ